MLGMILSIVVIYLFYYIWIIINFDKNGNSKKKSKKKHHEKKMPVEIQYFVTKYNIDLDKVNYRYFLKLMGLVVAFDLSIVGSIIIYIETLWLQLLVGFVLVLVVVLISFKLLGNYLNKKGLTKDENSKRNRKEMAKVLGRK